MTLFKYGKDGGPDSTVWGYWLIEAKSLFSIALLCFEDGSRDKYHEHAFNSVSWLLKGELHESGLLGYDTYSQQMFTWGAVFKPSLWPIFTKRQDMHKVTSIGRSWVLTFRGPWKNVWREWDNVGGYITLTNGRKQL